MSENVNDNRPLDQDTYLNTRNSYNEAELEVSGRYDKWILTLSGGALGLSITFIEKIATNPTADTLFWLKLSWICLVLSLLAALLSLVTSQSAIRENRKELDLANSEQRAPRLCFPRWFTYFTNILNWGALLFFIFGVVFMCIFSFKNIDQRMAKGGMVMTTKQPPTRQPQKKLTKDGYVPSPPPTQPIDKHGFVPPAPPSTPKKENK